MAVALADCPSLNSAARGDVGKQTGKCESRMAKVATHVIYCRDERNFTKRKSAG